MYFSNRTEAGDLLANRLTSYRYENTAVLALSTNGVLVGEQIAKRLHCGLSLLLTTKIEAPGDESLVIGAVDQEGQFTFNGKIPPGEMEEYMQDLRGYLEEEKIRQLYDMTSIIGEGGVTQPELLTGRNIIITSDGIKSGLSIDAALHYLKPLKTEKIIAAIPVGPADAIEALNIKCDEVYYLYIPDNFMGIDHYYEDNTKPDPQTVLAKINSVVSNWI